MGGFGGAQSFYLSDYESPHKMIQACFNKIIIKKYKGYRIYVHNLSNFDGIFIIDALINSGDYNTKFTQLQLLQLTE